MFNISGYLEKFKKLGDKRDRTRQLVADSFREEANVDIDLTSVSVSNGEVGVSVPQGAQTIVFMKRQNILAALKRKLPDVFIDRIRCR